MMKGFNTKLIHAGEPRPRIEGAVTLPIFQSSTFESVEINGEVTSRYLRLNNSPNHIALHEKLAAIEGAEAALVTASGMAAISAALLGVLKPGDRVMIQSDLYGGTHSFATGDLREIGIGVDFFDAEDPASWESILTAKTRAVYVESISNPMMRVADLEAVVDFARSHGLVSMIDNTFTSPVNYRPPEAGFDLSIHSGTKYLNGHSDILAGAVIGTAELVEKSNRKLLQYGGTLDPHACFLLHRGLKTLDLRVRRHNENALALARFLAGHPRVTRVNYPGLPDSPWYERASRLFDGFGGMLSFEVGGGTEAAVKLLEKLELPINAPSLGGVESLVTLPAGTSHASLTPEERKAAGISDGLIRFSTGIEDASDLIEDLQKGLHAL